MLQACMEIIALLIIQMADRFQQAPLLRSCPPPLLLYIIAGKEMLEHAPMTCELMDKGCVPHGTKIMA